MSREWIYVWGSAAALTHQSQKQEEGLAYNASSLADFLPALHFAQTTINVALVANTATIQHDLDLMQSRSGLDIRKKSCAKTKTAPCRTFLLNY